MSRSRRWGSKSLNPASRSSTVPAWKTTKNAMPSESSLPSAPGNIIKNSTVRCRASVGPDPSNAVFPQYKQAEDTSMWRCTICGYIYDDAQEGTKFEDLPDDWYCPICNAPKDAFVRI